MDSGRMPSHISWLMRLVVVESQMMQTTIRAKLIINGFLFRLIIRSFIRDAAVRSMWCLLQITHEQ